MIVKYIAEFSYGTPSLAEITVRKETPRTVVVESSKSLLGHITIWQGKTLQKSHLFDTKREAVAWLLEKAEAHVERMKRDLITAQNYEAALRMALTELDAAERTDE